MDNKIFIIAEVGLNHNGEWESAVKMVKEAAQAGADAVKFQNYKTEDFIFDKTLTYTYKSQGLTITEPMWDICKRCEVQKEWIPELKKMCDSLNIVFMSSPTSESGVDDLIKVGVKFLKNGSDYLSHLPLLNYMGSTGVPVIISTGMAYESEVREAVEAIYSGGGNQVYILHCTSSYPTEPAHANLRRMVSLEEQFNVPVGFSDHTIGSSAAIQAVSLGAKIIEKHFTLDQAMSGPDHWFSLNPKELEQYIRDIRVAESRLGMGAIEPAEAESKGRDEFRLSLIISRDIKKGEKISRSNIIIAKPGGGLKPKDINSVLGREIALDLESGTPLMWEHLQEVNL